MSLDQPEDFVKRQTVTHDAFLGGRLTVSQPRHGFRAGLDSVLLGAAVGQGAATLLDLGAGVGTASLVALAHHQRLAAVLAERDAGMLPLANANIEANGFADRARTLELDVAAKGTERQTAGLATDYFETVIANPPFFQTGTGTLAGPSRVDARHMAAGALDLWVKTAAASAAPGGEVIFIYPAEGLAALLAAFDKRFGAITLLPLAPRPDQPATRILMRGIKGSRAPLTMLATRILHEEGTRGFASQFDAIFRGEGRLDW